MRPFFCVTLRLRSSLVQKCVVPSGVAGAPVLVEDTPGGDAVLDDVLRKAADAVRGSNQPVTVPGFLRPIDTTRLGNDLRIAELAAERGQQDLPSTNSRSFDSVEQDIVHTIESEWGWQGGEFVNSLRAYAQRLVGYSIQSEFTKLEIEARDTLAKLRAADHRAEADLGPLREKFLGARDALVEFRKKHNLSRIAFSPAGRWTTFGLLGFIVSIESLLNGVFFSKGSDFGLVGGIGIAIAISFVNVCFCFILGLGPARGINLRNFLWKSLSFITTSAGIAATVALHGFAAHYRDAVGRFGEDRAFGEALAAIAAAPASLADVYSYLLFILGLLFSLGAFYKGYKFDDAYPFYGAKFRRAEEARDDYSDEHAELFDELESIKNDTIQSLEYGITSIPLFPQQAANIRAQRAALVQTFRGYETAVATAVNQLLSKYRDENRKHRSTPVPAYFDEQWRIVHSFLDSADVQILTAERNEKDIDTTHALNELGRYSKEVISEYEKLLLVYPHPTKMGSLHGT